MTYLKKLTNPSKPQTNNIKSVLKMITVVTYVVKLDKNYKLLLKHYLIGSAYQNESTFQFTILNSFVNHVNAINIRLQNGLICVIESHQTVFIASVLHLTRAHSPFKSDRWKCQIPLHTCFKRKWRCGNIKRTHLKW